MTFTKAKPGRRKAHLKWRHSASYDSHTRDLLNTHPDWIKPTKPLVEKVLNKWGDPIIEKQYTPPQREDDPLHKTIMGKSICERFVTYLYLQGGTYWLEEEDTLLNVAKRSLNYGSGELAKTAYQMESVSWK